jgi:hypothetical protein
MTEQTDQIDRDDNDFELEVVDDVPAEERPRLAEDHKADLPDDDEVEKYSESVQKRIKQLKFEYHEAERQKQEAIRLREEAIQYAQRAAEENQRLSERLSKGQNSVVESAKMRYQSEVERAKRDYKMAYEAGDSDGLVEAQQRLVEAQNSLSRVQNWRPQPVQPEYSPERLQQAYQQYQQKNPPVPQLDDRQRAWLADNDWFGKDEEMTGAAYGLHERLVRSGVDPNTDTYYAKINEGMRKRFPERFGGVTEEVDVTPRKTANVVAPAARSATNPRKVKLTSTQVALAKRLGLKPEQYAAQLLKDQRNG